MLKQVRNHNNVRGTLVRKIQNIKCSQNIRLYWVMYTVPYLNYQLTTTLKRSLKLVSYSELYDEKKYYLVYWVGDRAGMQYSVRSFTLTTVPYSMKNLVTSSHFSSDVRH